MADDLTGVNPEVRVKIIAALQDLRKKGVKVNINSAHRTAAEQQDLIDRFNRGEPGIFSPAPVGHSPHQKGIAVDLGVEPKHRGTVNKVMANYGFNWGGNKDPVHYNYMGLGGLIPERPTISRNNPFAVPEKEEKPKPTLSANNPFAVPKGQAGPKPAPKVSASNPFAIPKQGVIARTLTKVAETVEKIPIIGPYLSEDPNTKIGRLAAEKRKGEAEMLTKGLQIAGTPGRAMDAFLTAVGSEIKRIDKERVAAIKAGKKPRSAQLTFDENVRVLTKAFNAAKDLEGNIPPDLITQLRGLKPGDKGYIPARVIDYAISIALDPTSAVGKPIGKVTGAMRQGFVEGAAPQARVLAAEIGKSVQDAAERVSPGVTKKVERGLEWARAGSSSSTVKGIERPYRENLEESIGKLGRITRSLEQKSIDLQVKNPTYAAAVKTWKKQRQNALRRARGSDLEKLRDTAASPLHYLIAEYASKHIPKFDPMTGKFSAVAEASAETWLQAGAKKYGLDPTLVKRYTKLYVKQALDNAALAKASGEDLLRVPNQILGGEGSDTFFRNFVNQSFVKGAAERIGDIGYTQFAGTGVKVVRRAHANQLAKQIAENPAWVREVGPAGELAGWERVTDEIIKTYPALAPLRDKQIPGGISRLLQREFKQADVSLNRALQAWGIPASEVDDVQNFFLRQWQQLVGNVKVGLISRPKTQVANTISNYGQLMLAAEVEGLNKSNLRNLKLIRQAFADVRKDRHADIKAYGPTFNYTNSSTVRAPAARMAEEAAGVAGNVVNIPGKGRTYVPSARQVGRSVLTAGVQMQDLTEKAFKLHLFREAIKSGKTPQQARDIANKYLFDYSDRSALLEAADRNGLWIFSTYPTKAFNLMVDTLMNRPDIVAKYYRRREQLFEENPGSREQFKGLPDFDRTFATIPIGDGKFFNASRFLGLGGSFNTLMVLSDMVEKRQIRPEAVASILTAPLVGPAIDAMRNTRPTGELMPGNPIVEPGEPEYPNIPIQGREGLRSALTGPIAGQIARSYVPGVAEYQDLKNARQGTTARDVRYGEVQPWEAALINTLTGGRISSAEGSAERRKRLAPDVAARARGANQYARQMLNEARSTPDAENRYFDTVEKFAFDEARKKLEETKRYFRGLITSGKVVDNEGNLTDSGRERLEKGALYLFALARRVRRAAAQERERRRKMNGR